MYGIQQSLPLFRTWTREEYDEEATSIGAAIAPAYDPNRELQLWFDSAAKSGHTTYKTLKIAPDGTYFIPLEFISMYLTPAHASTPNFPPYAANYPAWVPAESDAEIISGGTVASGINPDYLSTEQQAQDMYNAFAAVVGGEVTGGLQLWTPAPGPGDIHVQYGEDPRRAYQFEFKGAMVIVGFLLRDAWAKGIGYPGTWDLSGPEPVFVFGEIPPGPPPNAPVIPVPMRELYADESWVIPAIGQPDIERK